MLVKICGLISVLAVTVLIAITFVLALPSAVDAGSKSATVQFGFDGELPAEADRVEGPPLVISPGTTVTFDVSGSGFHQPAVYDVNCGPDTFRGSTELETNFNSIIPSAGGDVNSSDCRLALGPSPRQPGLTAAERVDGRLDLAHKFDKKGQYLVICNIKSHWEKYGMSTFVFVK